MKEKTPKNSFDMVVAVDRNEKSLSGRSRYMGQKILSAVKNVAEGNPMGAVRDPNEANHMAIWEDHFRTEAVHARGAAKRALVEQSSQINMERARLSDQSADKVGKNASRKFQALVDAGADPEVVVATSRAVVPEAKLVKDEDITRVQNKE